MTTQGQNAESVGEVSSGILSIGSPDKPFLFQTGEELVSAHIAYETYGTLSESRDNAVLVFHALSGSQHAAGINRSVPEAGPFWTDDLHVGWWDDFIGPGKAIDTRQFFVICANYVGGCYGSSGPSTIDPQTGKPYGRSFPTVMIGDIVNSQVTLLDHLGVETLHATVGGSLGGLCALNLAARYPKRVRIVIPIAAGIEVTLLQRILNYEQICAIEEDTHFQGGNYYDGEKPRLGLALARMISHKTYRSLASLESTARKEVIRPDTDQSKWYWLSHPVESYFRNQGLKFVERFDANTYLRIMDAWQRFDLIADSGKMSYAEIFEACRDQKYMVFSIDSDVCFYPDEQTQLCRLLKQSGVPYQQVTVHSEKGHDAFLLEPHLFAPHLHFTLQDAW